MPPFRHDAPASLTTEALTLTDAERAALASELLHTLPAVLSDPDEGVSEAVRRDIDLSANPAKGVDWPTLKKISAAKRCR